jgi:Acyl-CoA reductase (LuxC)
MTTAERAADLASAAESFAGFLGSVSARQLLDLVATELGDPAILDEFRPRAGGLSRALAPRSILHVLSGNTPHAALQTLLRGLLLGAHNRCKLPAGGLPEVAAFRAALPASLASRVELSESLSHEWVSSADAVIVFGGDETIAEFHRRMRPGQIFCAHGHRVSFGIILDDHSDSLPHAARDASLFDQRGCLSPHVFYVRGDSAGFAQSLATEMAAFNAREPRRPLSAADAVRIQAAREDYRFRAANDDHFAIWMSEDGKSTDWTVIHDAANPEFTVSPLDRVIFVKPLPAELGAALANVSAHLSAVGYWPPGEAHARWVAEHVPGASRICPLGEMQFPPLTWHQDGFPVLSSLVRWVDLET